MNTRSRIAAAILAPLITLAPVTWAQTADLAEPDRSAIEEMFAGYNRALVQRDYTALREHLEVPFVVVDGTSRLVSDLDAVIAGFQRLRDALDQQSYGGSTPGPPRYLVLSAERVLMSRAIRHSRKDGTLIGERANVYLLRRSGRRWRIAGTLQQDPIYAGMPH